MKKNQHLIIISALVFGMSSQSISQTQINYHEKFYDNPMKWTTDIETEGAFVLYDTVENCYFIEEFEENTVLCRAPVSSNTKYNFSYSYIIDSSSDYWCSIGLAGDKLKIHFEVDHLTENRYRINISNSGEYKTGKWKNLKDVLINDSLEITTFKIECNNRIIGFYLNDYQVIELNSKLFEENTAFSHFEISVRNSNIVVSDIHLKGYFLLNDEQKILAGDGISPDELKDKKMYTVSDALDQPTKVYKLSIDYTWKHEYLPTELFQCRKLQQVYIYGEEGVDYYEMINDLSGFPQLQFLELDGLDEIPASVKQLTNLRSLKIIFCKSKEVPQEIGSLNKLKRLDLFRNNFETLPQSFSNLMNLEYLNLADNDFKSIPKFVFSFEKLKHLDLAYNDLTFIDDEIGNLKKLESLNIKSNYLENLPKSIGNLTKLKILDIGSYEKIKKLPPEIGNLTSLEVFDMSGCDGTPCNGLEEIPVEFGNLTNLKEVNFDVCQIKTIPDELTNLKKLVKFYIEGEFDDKEIERIKKMFSYVKDLRLKDIYDYND